MAATGKTPILLYGSTTATNAPATGNLTNSSDGCEIAINVADKNLFFKDATNIVNTVPIRQSSASSNGWLSSTDWTTFNNKASTSSPTFSGDVTLSTGNLVIGTSGKGIDFSATADATATSELLADYEEGDWTPTLVFASGSAVLNSTITKGKYTKVGRLVTLTGAVYVTSVSSPTGETYIGGLPYTPNSGYGFRSASAIFGDTLQTTATTSLSGIMIDNVARIYIYKFAAGVSSNIGADIKASSTFNICILYMV